MLDVNEPRGPRGIRLVEPCLRGVGLGLHPRLLCRRGRNQVFVGVMLQIRGNLFRSAFLLALFGFRLCAISCIRCRLARDGRRLALVFYTLKTCMHRICTVGEMRRFSAQSLRALNALGTFLFQALYVLFCGFRLLPSLSTYRIALLGLLITDTAPVKRDNALDVCAEL